MKHRHTDTSFLAYCEVDIAYIRVRRKEIKCRTLFNLPVVDLIETDMNMSFSVTLREKSVVSQKIE